VRLEESEARRVRHFTVIQSDLGSTAASLAGSTASPRPAATIALLCAIASATPAVAQPLPLGKSDRTEPIAGVAIKVFAYRPACKPAALLIVVPGQNRNARDYRDWARPLADRDCLLVVAPELDRARFPQWRYQHGGIVTPDGKIAATPALTGNMIVALAGKVGEWEGKPMPYSLIGHSAGAQFLGRLAAFVPNAAQRIVLANPGTYVFPSLDAKVPYGFGGLDADPARAKATLRAYLAQPVTIYLGREDTKDEGLNEGAQAMAQGATRYERGRNAFRTAEALAKSSSWSFNWRLVELPGVGHKASKMLAAPEASQALRR